MNPADSSHSTHIEPQTIVPVIVMHVTEGALTGKTLRFTDHQTLTIGRSPTAGLQLTDDPRISRYHCRLELNPPTCSIIDLDSANGTIVNGKKIKEATLSHGDEIVLGGSRFNIAIEHSLAAEEFERSFETPVAGVTPVRIDRREQPEIGGYRIERILGQGGMGVVYLANRLSTGERVAIKVIRPAVATNRKMVEKFRRETAIVLRLQHKRIIRALDFQYTNDHLPALIMEYIQEVKLRDLLAELTIADRCRIATQVVVRVLEGLQYAHEREIVHRDVKPGNILIAKAGEKLKVKLADFGLAKNYIDAGFSNCSTSNETCGTLAYMPPEQIIDCRHAKPSCDIYAAGVCLYNLISDRLPYEAENLASQITAILNHEPIPLSAQRDGVSNSLIRVIDTAMARDPADRYATAAEMRRDLLAVTKER